MELFEPRPVLEVVPGLILGGLGRLRAILDLHPDTLLSLEAAPETLRAAGFRGEILYRPIPDGGVLPDDALEELVGSALARIRAGRRVAVFCAGGRGRTGYVAACILFLLGKEDPVAFLRRAYLPGAVETEAQEDAVERFRRRHIAETFWGCVQAARTVRVRSAAALDRDADVRRVYHSIGRELGPRARFTLRRTAVPTKLRLVAEAPDAAACEAAIDRFTDVLREKGHLIDADTE